MEGVRLPCAIADSHSPGAAWVKKEERPGPKGVDTLKLFKQLPAGAHEVRLLLRVKPLSADARELSDCELWKEA